MNVSSQRPAIEHLEGRVLLASVTGKYTYFGDADLDPQVDGDDYFAIDLGVRLAPPTFDDRILKLSVNRFEDEPPVQWTLFNGAAPDRQAVVIDDPQDTFTFGQYVYARTGDNTATLTITEPADSVHPEFVTTMKFAFTSATAGNVAVSYSIPVEEETGTFEFGSSALLFGLLEVRGTIDRDDVRIAVDGDNLTVTHNGKVETHPLDEVSRINVLTLDGDDKVTLGDGIPGTYVAAGAGRDTINGGSGDETLAGGAGPDRIDGGGGNDRLNGNGSRDSLAGGAGDDRLYGGEGDDTMSGLSGKDRLWAGGGNDNLNGGTSADKLNGEDGDDVLAGGNHGDRLDGGAGNDLLVGGDGNDSLTGGSDDDTFDGGPGADSMFGNGDDDLFNARDGVIDLVDGGDGTDEARIDAAELAGLIGIENPVTA